MKITGKISMMINREETIIEVKDAKANTKFLEITLTPEQLVMLLARFGSVDCELNIRGLERIGKVHENKMFEFRIPADLASSSHEEELAALAQSKLTDGWIAEKYFSSQNSFFKKDGIQFARCTIRRYL